MSRVSPKVHCTPSDITALNSIINNPLSDPALVRRAQVILEYSKGELTNKQIAEKLGIRPNTLIVWRDRFLEGGIDGLMDRPHPGRRGNKQPPLIAVVRALLDQAPPNDASAWTVPLLMQATGEKADAIRRALRALDVTLGRPRSWKIKATLTPSSRTIEVCAVYLSRRSACALLAVHSNGNAGQMSVGELTTRRSEVAQVIDCQDQPRGLPLREVIERIVQIPQREFDHAQLPTLQEFVSSVISRLSPREELQYHLLEFGATGLDAERPRLQHCNICVSSAPDKAGWLQQLRTWLQLLDGQAPQQVDGLLAQIKAFMDTVPDRGEPLLWCRCDLGDSGTTTTVCRADVAAAFENPDVDNVTEVYACVHYRNGQVVCQRMVTANMLPALEKIDCSSPSGVADYAGQVEDGLLAARNGVFKGMFQGCLNAAVKKKNRTTR